MQSGFFVAYALILGYFMLAETTSYLLNQTCLLNRCDHSSHNTTRRRFRLSAQDANKKRHLHFCKCPEMVETKGFEPSTSRMRTERSRMVLGNCPPMMTENGLVPRLCGFFHSIRNVYEPLLSFLSSGCDSGAAHLNHIPLFCLGGVTLLHA